MQCWPFYKFVCRPSRGRALRRTPYNRSRPWHHCHAHPPQAAGGVTASSARSPAQSAPVFFRRLTSAMHQQDARRQLRHAGERTQRVTPRVWCHFALLGRRNRRRVGGGSGAGCRNQRYERLLATPHSPTRPPPSADGVEGPWYQHRAARFEHGPLMIHVSGRHQLRSRARPQPGRLRAAPLPP